MCSQVEFIFVEYYTVYCAVYCTVYCTASCIIYCAVYTVYGTEYGELDTLYDRHRTAQQIIFEGKLADGFSSNVEGDGPLTSEIRYISTRSSVESSQESLSSEVLKAR